MTEYAQWGDIVFELLSYREHREENTYVYARHETIFPPSSLQWMGKELRKLNMTIRWHNQWCNPEEKYREFREEAEKGEAKKLIIATKVVGDFVVEKINATVEQVDVWGRPVIVDVDVEFTEYVKKEIQKRQIKTKKQQAPARAKKPEAAEKKVVTKTNPDGYTYRRIE